MFLTAGNVSKSSKVGLLFINFEDPDRLRVHGEATVSFDDPLLASFPGAELIYQVKVLEVFPNCPRYIHQYERKALSKFVPAPDGSAPEPEWKDMDWSREVLPKRR